MSKTQELIPSFWENCQNDPRLDNDSRDVFAYMRETNEQFDIIVSDLTDPEDEGYTPFSESTADHIYTEEGIRLFSKCLAPNGIFVMQAQELSLIHCEGHIHLRRLLEKVFRRVYSYRVFIEFFGYWESFLIALNDQLFSPNNLSTSYSANMNKYNGRLRGYLSDSSFKALFAFSPRLDLYLFSYKM